MAQLSTYVVGQLIEHDNFHYRGVIFDIDPMFLLSDEWYEEMATSCPPKDEPWYHVLVDNAVHSTYVAQQHLKMAESGEQISHPMLGRYFKAFIDGRYVLR